MNGGGGRFGPHGTENQFYLVQEYLGSLYDVSDLWLWGGPGRVRGLMIYSRVCNIFRVGYMVEMILCIRCMFRGNL